MKTFHLDILTPFGKYYSADVEFLRVQSSEYLLGILPDHAPLISTLVISEMEITRYGIVEHYAIGGGVINIKDNQVTLLLDSVEKSSEIDAERARLAKERAENRLKEHSDNQLEVTRAEAALNRAINRLNIANKFYSK